MSVNKKLCLVIINFCFVLICNAQVDYFNSANWADKDYLDPHSFYYDKHTKEETLLSGENDNHEIGDYKGDDASKCYKQLHKCKSAQNTDIADALLSRRIVNIILSRGNFKKDGSYFNGRIELEASISEFEALQNFGLGKLTLREIDPILNKVIQAPVFDIVNETAMWFYTVSFFLWDILLQIWDFMLQHKEYVAVAFSLPCLYYFVRITRWNFWIVLTFGIQLIFVGSFFITYWRLIQEAKIKHTAAQMRNIEVPVQCHPHKMGILDKLRSWYDNQDCEKYFEAVMHNPVYEVTPAQALTHMLANSMFEPVVLSGKAISAFLKNVTGDIPWPLNLIYQPLYFAALIPAVILLIILLSGGSLNLGFGPFSLFSLRGPQSSAPRQSERLESKKNRQPIEVMLNVTANLQLPPSIVNASGRSNNLTITTYPEFCGRDEEKKSSPQKEITHHDKASGDSETTDSPGTSKQMDEGETEDEVQKRKLAERGSGDHSCLSE